MSRWRWRKKRPFPLPHPSALGHNTLMKRQISLLALLFLLSLWISRLTAAANGSEPQAYLPFLTKSEAPPEPMVEFRALWVTRFEWTADPTPAKIDEIVNNAAYAGFNVILFQVRGEADALYQSDLEPWSRYLTGTLGQDPGWDPLAYMIDKAHAQDIQVHAYFNVYPVWLGCDPPPADTTPQHFYYQLIQAHGTSGGQNNGLQWTTSYQTDCGSYQRATPASIFGDDHYLAVAADLVTRYDIDGLHLDHIRYGGAANSCDPVSELAYGTNCFGDNGQMNYTDWQRAQVNGTVYKFFNEIVPMKENFWLSAAVWPIYINKPEWGWPSTTEGYYDYYQDSKAWVRDGYIHAISPMIYPVQFNCPYDGFWTQARWETLVMDFQAGANGRYIFPGIGAGYCDFAEIEARINMARAIGTGGQAIFSYSSLLSNGYFDDLAEGPYRETAVVPPLPTMPATFESIQPHK
ncbi:MAG: family 10 glycosylhydrolase [Ardenticatenaceae bacterium]|nr:family 10 glycosylhydrolase [Ardenticatenaceae bacterium]